MTNKTLHWPGSGPLAAAWVLSGLMSAVANAAEAEVQPLDSASLEEITVTAQRKVESVLQVPSSIEVFNARAIEGLGITDIQDIARLTPGLYMPANSANSSNTTNITIRGIGSDIS